MENRFALITTNNRTGLLLFAKALDKLGFKIVASIKTSEFLKKAGLKVTDVKDITGYPPIMGRQGIKLIHPKIFGGILGDKTKRNHRKDAKKFGINFFDLVVCNFYPFEKITSEKKFFHGKAITNIDVGGPAMVRCAAKNYKNVTIIVDPADYALVLNELQNFGAITFKTRKKLALKAFKHTRKYDDIIIKYLSSKFNIKNGM